jgi:hypothetical protein
VQLPQCAASDAVFAHTPLQFGYPYEHAQVPAEQNIPALHDCPHAPQLPLSEFVSTQALPHWVRGEPHPCAVVPPVEPPSRAKLLPPEVFEEQPLAVRAISARGAKTKDQAIR